MFMVMKWLLKQSQMQIRMQSSMESLMQHSLKEILIRLMETLAAIFPSPTLSLQVFTDFFGLNNLISLYIVIPLKLIEGNNKAKIE